jgi:hypothetical protein
MVRLILALLVSFFLAVPAMAQEELPPEDQCNQDENYWSDNLEQCFVMNDMDDDEIFIFRKIKGLLQEKAQLQHTQQEFNAAAKAERKANFDAVITKFVAKRDATEDEELKAIFQERIDYFTDRRDVMDARVVDYGQQISDLSSTIGKLKEVLDASLQ